MTNAYTIQLVFQVNYAHYFFFNLAKLKNKQMTKILTYKSNLKTVTVL